MQTVWKVKSINDRFVWLVLVNDQEVAAFSNRVYVDRFLTTSMLPGERLIWDIP